MALHIGEKIRERARELRIGPTELARSINTSKQNVYGIFKRRSLDTDLLRKISKALEFDFFCYYRDQKLPQFTEPTPSYGKKQYLSAEQKITALEQKVKFLQQQITDLQEKYEMVKRINELLEKKSVER
ncbi:MAG: helix-turn-helix domain-containing protein [Bacteroidetes bacterium]|nr:helix-turn-helix domain-containing protein [Bacteroidota bacterium]